MLCLVEIVFRGLAIRYVKARQNRRTKQGRPCLVIRHCATHRLAALLLTRRSRLVHFLHLVMPMGPGESKHKANDAHIDCAFQVGLSGQRDKCGCQTTMVIAKFVSSWLPLDPSHSTRGAHTTMAVTLIHQQRERPVSVLSGAQSTSQKKSVVGKRRKARVVRQVQMQIWLQVLCHVELRSLCISDLEHLLSQWVRGIPHIPHHPTVVCDTAAEQQPGLSTCGHHDRIFIPKQGAQRSSVALCPTMLTKCDNSKGRHLLNDMWRLGVMLRVLATSDKT